MAKEEYINSLSGSVELSTGTAPTPYQVDAGHCLLIGGTADLVAVKKHLSNEQAIPIENRDGRAFVGIWICDFQQANLGPHFELQFSYLVSKQPLKPLKPNPFAILHLLAVNPSAGMLAGRIWNDSQTVVVYNREHLGLHAQLAAGEIQRDITQQTKRFSFSQDGNPILSGQVHEAQKQSSAVTRSLLRLFGLRNAIKFANPPWIKVKIINPIGEILEDNRAAQTFTHAEKVILQHFDPAADTLEIQDPHFQELDFQPQFVEHLDQIKFIYLDPVEW